VVPPDVLDRAATNGVVLAVVKKLPSKLVDEDSVQLAVELADHVGCVFSGMPPDYRVLVRKARKKAEAYWKVYKEGQPTAQMAKDVAQIMQQFTQSGGVRPFGVSMLIAGYDHEGPQLFQVDPSGAHFEWKATAIGKGMTQAKTYLQKRYHEEMELEDAIHTALLTLKEGFEGEMTETNIEVAVVGADKKFRLLTPHEIRDYLLEAQ
jgi:20S proteasome subunit alpha 2